MVSGGRRGSIRQTCQPSRIFRDSPGNLTSLPESRNTVALSRIFTSRSMRCVIVVRARDLKISIRIYTHTRTTCSILPCVCMCPAWGVKLEKRLDVCAHGKRASKITLSVYHARTINIRAVIMSRPKASHTLTPVQA